MSAARKTLVTATAQGWVALCAYTDLIPERGAAALVGGRQIALFRAHDGRLFAVGNRDPYSGAYVMSRGITGTRGEEPVVATPMYKQVFSWSPASAWTIRQLHYRHIRPVSPTAPWR